MQKWVQVDGCTIKLPPNQSHSTHIASPCVEISVAPCEVFVDVRGFIIMCCLVGFAAFRGVFVCVCVCVAGASDGCHFKVPAEGQHGK